MRVADIAPAYCSGCFQSKPQMRHIDFQVAWDGPTIKEGLATGDGVQHEIAVTIDDLILCEECVCAAAAHVGMVDPGKESAELAQMREINERLVERNRGLEDYASKMEAAVSARPAQPQRKQKAGVS